MVDNTYLPAKEELDDKCSLVCVNDVGDMSRGTFLF